MRVFFLILVLGLTFHLTGRSQANSAGAYEKFKSVTASLNGQNAYTCKAILKVSYLKTNKSLFDTSTLIYRNGATYYKSKIVEKVEGAEGELTINHELRTATFMLSDSLRQVVYDELKIKPDREFESLLDSNFKLTELNNFDQFVDKDCELNWDKYKGMDQISIKPVKQDKSPLVSMLVRFDASGRIRYYEYTVRDIYAKNWDGQAKYRIIKTIYDEFSYDRVPQFPVTLNDYIKWEGWKISLKKYSNYTLNLL